MTAAIGVGFVGSGVLDEGLIEQVALVRSLTGRLQDARGSRHKAAYHVSAGVDALAVNLAGTITSIGAAQVRLDLIAPTEHWQVRFDSSTPANATHIARYDATGGQIQPTLYESGRRAVWRHMAAAIADGEPLPYSVGDLADDMQFVRDATRQRSAPEDANDH
jgi:hypothetical protein